MQGNIISTSTAQYHYLNQLSLNAGTIRSVLSLNKIIVAKVIAFRSFDIPLYSYVTVCAYMIFLNMQGSQQLLYFFKQKQQTFPV